MCVYLCKVNELQLLYFACTCMECQSGRATENIGSRLGLAVVVVFKLKLGNNSCATEIHRSKFNEYT